MSASPLPFIVAEHLKSSGTLLRAPLPPRCRRTPERDDADSASRV